MKDLFHVFFSNNPKLSRMRKTIEEVAMTDATLLIRGEHGCGKELVAQAVHYCSPRSSKPFVKVNCAAIPKGLLESELFGHEKGAFTGAHLRKPGKFELANGGTILLNEIGEMDISVQPKLLQVLQDGEFFRLGGEENQLVNTRVIATTKEPLERLIAEGRFRQDLYYRLNVITIKIPPLRDRRDQIVPLSQYFFGLYKTRYGRDVAPLSFRLLSAFKDYDWPGNIRELENTIKRLVLIQQEEAVLEELIQRKSESKNNSQIHNREPVKGLEEETLFDLRELGKRAAEKVEKDLIQKVLNETHWNRKEAARLLHISYKGLLMKIQKYQLDRSSKPDGSGGISRWTPRTVELGKGARWDWAES